MPKLTYDLREASKIILKETNGQPKIGTPLGLGKPNRLLNELYNQVKADSSERLEIFTALSLSRPTGSSFYEERFYKPFLERHYGKDYPELLYVKEQNNLPPNIKVYEFYFQAGQALRVSTEKRSLLRSAHVGI